MQFFVIKIKHNFTQANEQQCDILSCHAAFDSFIFLLAVIAHIAICIPKNKKQPSFHFISLCIRGY